MAFGPIMRFTINDLTIELAPLTREAVGEFVNIAHGGGMQRHSVTRYLNRRLAPVLEDEYEWYEKVRTSNEQITWGIWLIEGESRTLIGNSALRELGVNDAGYIRQAESASVIFRPEYWGKGVGSAAHKSRTWYAFTQLGLHRVKATIVKGNRGSGKALSRSGYTYTHTERNMHFVDGEMHHERHYECLNPYDTFWSQWWGSEEVPAGALEARQRTREAMSWAERNVTLT
jgi:RimJ/RimL family protein N-acetyltransferase